MALFVMAANTGAAVGSQIMRKSDAPLYRTGFRVCECLVSFGLLVSILQWAWYRHGNRVIRSGEAKEGGRVVEYVE